MESVLVGREWGKLGAERRGVEGEEGFRGCCVGITQEEGKEKHYIPVEERAPLAKNARHDEDQKGGDRKFKKIPDHKTRRSVIKKGGRLMTSR